VIEKEKARVNTIPWNHKPSAQADCLQYWWQPSKSRHVKINVDACLKDGHAGLGIIARDAHGLILLASSQICFITLIRKLLNL
jgi:hypothetical protein